MDLGELHKVWEVRPLKTKPGSTEAQTILDRIAKQVQPIMRRRKWKVKLLSEFCPANPALLGLNVNGGTAVRLRLRRPRRETEFLPYEQVLDTMLHELCHIERGPHDAAFYRLWDEVRKECEDLIAKGVTGTGQGLDLPGRHLGGFSRQPPLSALRQTALAAAEKRQRVGSLLPSGPKRLGGDSDIMTALSPIQAAAMAAERRLQDDLWCGSTCDCDASSSSIDDLGGSENHEPCRPETSSTTSTMSRKRSSDIISKMKEPQNGFFGYKNDGTSSAIDLSSCISQPFVGRSCGPQNHSSSSRQSATDTLVDQTVWECGICTLINQPLSLVCEACGIQRPKDATSRSKVWPCKFCTLDNSDNGDIHTAHR